MTYLLVVLTGLFAGFTGPFTASSSLIIIPFLLFMGFAPHEALAINVLASFCSWVTIGLHMLKAKKVVWRFFPALFIVGVTGATIGASAVLATPPEILGKLIGPLIVFSAVLVLVKKNIGVIQTIPGRLKAYTGIFFYALVSVYAGFFAGGSGIMFRIICLSFFGFQVVQSAATGGLIWMFIAGISSAFYAVGGYINAENLIVSLVLAMSMSLGSHFGAKSMLNIDPKPLKFIFVATTLCMGAIILYQQFF